jgi:hypothetical protein
MTKALNSQGLPFDGKITPLDENCDAQITLRVSDEDMVVPKSIEATLPDPFSGGVLLRGYVGEERIFVGFPSFTAEVVSEKDSRNLGNVALLILLSASSETLSPIEDQSVFSLAGVGDWFQLSVGGEDMRLFALHRVEVTDHSSPSGNHFFN